MSPWDYSLKELAWTANAVRMEEWDKVAWLTFHIPWTGGKGQWTSYNPLRLEKKKADKAALDKAGADAELPETLTEEEIEARWLAYKEGLKNA